MRLVIPPLRRVAVLLIALSVLPPAAVPASAAEDPAEAIRREARERDEKERRWTDRTQSIDLAIEGGDAPVRTRRIRYYEKRLDIRERRVLIRILDPATLRDFGFLGFARAGGGNDGWVYLSEYKRSRRVSKEVGALPFVGSDLTHDDLNLVTVIPGWDEHDAPAKLRGVETIDGVACHVIDLAPRPDVAYRRIRVWFGEQDLFAHRLEFFADGEHLTKRLSQREIRPLGTIPVANEITIETPGATKTTIRVNETVFDTGLSDACFTLAVLEDVSKELAQCRGPAAR